MLAEGFGIYNSSVRHVLRHAHCLDHTGQMWLTGIADISTRQALDQGGVMGFYDSAIGGLY